jgi:dipeptidyl aminopeptidase/acylaminoacyl peptidase
VQLTSGAIAFDRALPSKDGQRLFAAGYGPRGEVVRYDARKRSFVPLLPGISADFVTFSRDGEWIAYVTFPEGVLWRSRTDQTERVQLTQPSANSAAVLPRWSPDGTQVLYSVTAAGQLTRTYLVPAGGGRPEELSAGPNQVLTDPNWSADGKRICYCGDHLTGRPSNAPNIHILDLASRTVSDVPGSEEFFSPRWSPDGRYLAALSLDSSRIGCWSHDSRAIYYIQKSANPAVMRIRLEGRGAERAVDLRDIRLAGFYGFSLSLTPDDQPVLVRDVGAEEVFALDWATR